MGDGDAATPHIVQFCSDGCGSYPGKSCKWAFSTLQDRALRPQSQFFRSFPGLFFLNRRGIRSVARRQNIFYYFLIHSYACWVVARLTLRLHVAAEATLAGFSTPLLAAHSSPSRASYGLTGKIRFDRASPTWYDRQLFINQPR